MTPERKKKLRLLLRKKAAEELKKEQERKAAERRKVIDERCGQPKDVDNASEDELIAICKEYHSKLFKLEGDKWDLERGVNFRIQLKTVKKKEFTMDEEEAGAEGEGAASEAA